MTAALFETLQGRYSDGTPVSELEGRSARIRSIQDHLQRLLNARYDVLAHIPEHGLPDLPSLYDGLPYSLDAMTRIVRNTILRFEPRLQHVQVSARYEEKTDSVVQLDITGVLQEGGMARFRTSFMSDGGAEIRSGAGTHAGVF